MMAERSGRKLKGWHVALIFASFFAVIIVVNLALAFNAVSTFPGLEVKNSYVASQSFDARRAQQAALGWDVGVALEGGDLRVAITDADGQPVQVAKLEATFGRATHVYDDQTPDFVFDGKVYAAPVEAAEGYWNLRMKANALDGTPFEQRVEIYVSE